MNYLIVKLCSEIRRVNKPSSGVYNMVKIALS